MLSKDRSLNLKLSLNKFLRERLSVTYYINYLASADEEIEGRISEKVEGYWRWIDIHWLRIGQGIFSISLIQINGNTIKENDRYGVELAKMMNEIQEELNQDTIPLLDFEGDPLNPVPTDNVLIPRFRGERSVPDGGQGTVNVSAMDYNIYVWRESVLP